MSKLKMELLLLLQDIIQKIRKIFTVDEKEEAALEISLQLILVESLDPVMYNHVVNCTNARHIWETIETINEGT